MFIRHPAAARPEMDDGGPPESLQYTVQGVVHERSKYMDTWADGVRSSDFQVVVKGAQWFVTLGPWPQPELPAQGSGRFFARPVIPISEEAASDGTNSYYLSTFATAGGDGTRGEGEVTAAAVPIRGGSGMMSLWYAYASHPHLHQRTNDLICPLGPPGLKRPLPLHKALVLDIDPGPPGLPKSIHTKHFTAEGTTTFSNEARFDVLAFTNVAGLRLPSRVRTEYSHEMFGDSHFTVDIELKQAALQADLDSFKPALNGSYRFISRDALATNAVLGVKESVSIRTNEWPSPQAFGARRKQWEAPGRGRQPPRPCVVLGLLTLVFFGPLLVLLRRMRSRPGRREIST
jgi:hypothetical protein